MIPLPERPKIVILINPSNGTILAVASNIAPDLDVEVTTSHEGFNAESLGKPFIQCGETLKRVLIKNIHLTPDSGEDDEEFFRQRRTVRTTPLNV